MALCSCSRSKINPVILKDLPPSGGQNCNCQWKSSDTHKGVQNKSSPETQRKVSAGLRVRLTVQTWWKLRVQP